MASQRELRTTKFALLERLERKMNQENFEPKITKVNLLDEQGFLNEQGLLNEQCKSKVLNKLKLFKRGRYR
jgi:hypothetical protein